MKTERQRAMPHRRQYRRDIGGWAIVIGVYCIYLGVTWFIFPTSSRASGVEWINKSSFPITGLSAHHVAIWWIIGGVISLVGGILSSHKLMSALSISASIFFPSIVAVVFIGGWVDRSTETGLVSAGSYLFPAVVMIYAIFRESQRLRSGLVELPVSDVTGEMEAVE